MAAEKLPVVLLNDLPADDDAFGGHRGVAKAIVQLVTTEIGGRAIALVGPWGSGKSTVVKLLQKAATECADPNLNGDVEIFVFDAWAHEGDPLRRSFLERLIVALQRKKWVDKARWEGRLKELSNRRRKTDTTSSPILTVSGVTVLLLLYLSPLAIALVAASHNFWHKRTILTLGIVTYLLPVFFSLYQLWKSRETKDGTKFSLLGLLFNRSVQRTTTDSFETPEPTSVEFQQIFRELAEEALGKNEKPRRQLLLVIDNLDRVEVQDALKLWSSMSAFIEYPSTMPDDWMRRTWTLVPFDETGIKRLWQTKGNTSLGEAFMAKTFQLRFNVPAPLLSDWSSFLEGQLRLAFPKHQDEEFYAISRIFSLLCAESQTPNPREIKGFINQMGSTYRSHPESIPLISHALLAALAHKGNDWKPGQDIRSEEKLQGYIGTEWASDLAALYYNVPRDQALQAVFGGEVESHLLNGEAKEISRLAEKPGLDRVILRVIQDKLLAWLKLEPLRIGRAAYACEAAGLLETPTWEEVWAKLEFAANSAGAFPTLDKRSGIGLAALIKRRDDGDLAKRLLQTLSVSDISEGPAPEKAIAWLLGAWEVVKALIASGHEEMVTEYFSVGRAPGQYLGLLGFAPPSDGNADIVPYLRPGCSPALIMPQLINAVSANGFATLEAAVRNMVRVPVTWDWGVLIAAMKNRLQQVNAQPHDVGAFIRTLFRLVPFNGEARVALGLSAQNGWILNYLSVSQVANLPEVVASCLIGQMVYHPEANGQSTPGAAMQGRNVYRAYMNNLHENERVFEALILQVEELIPVQTLVGQAKMTQVPKLALREIIKKLASGPNGSRIFDAKSIVDNREYLSSELGHELLSQLLSDSRESGKLTAELVERPFDGKLAGLYRLALDLPKGQNVREHVVEGLQAVSTEDWLKALNAADEPVLILIDLHDMGVTPHLDFKFQDALSGIADQTLEGVVPKTSPAQFKKLVGILGGDQRDIVQRHLAEEMAEAKKSLSVFAKYFGYLVEDCSCLYEVAEKLCRDGFPRLLDRLEETGLLWISQMLTICPGLRKKCKPSSLATLKNRLDSKLREKLSPEVEANVKKISESLGFESSV